MANTAYFNVNIYSFNLTIPEGTLEKGKYSLEFDFDGFRTMRTSATKDCKWPKEYLHTKYATEYPRRLGLKHLTVRFLKPSVFGFGDKHYFNPVKIDLMTIATGVMRYKVELAPEVVLTFILEMTQISDVSFEVRELLYNVTDREAFGPGEYLAMAAYEPSIDGAHIRELQAFVKAHMSTEEAASYRERKEEEIAELKKSTWLRKYSRTPAKLTTNSESNAGEEEGGGGGEEGVCLRWHTMNRILINDVSFRDLYYSALYIGIKRFKEKTSGDEMPFVRCTKIPLSRCLIHNGGGDDDENENENENNDDDNDSNNNRPRESPFPGDEDKIIHITGVLEGTVCINDVPYYTQVYAPGHYYYVPFQGKPCLMEDPAHDFAGEPAEKVPTEFERNALRYHSKFVEYGVPREKSPTPELEGTLSESNGDADRESEALLKKKKSVDVTTASSSSSSSSPKNGTLKDKLLP